MTKIKYSKEYFFKNSENLNFYEKILEIRNLESNQNMVDAIPLIETNPSTLNLNLINL